MQPRANMEGVMLGLVLALAMTPSACSMTIGIDKDGTLFSSRFSGWYKVSSKTIESDLHGGCYNDANPVPVSAVKVLLASKAPKSKVDFVLSILKRNGWSREKVQFQLWSGDPQAPL